jgi:hypothetical protein
MERMIRQVSNVLSRSLSCGKQLAQDNFIFKFCANDQLKDADISFDEELCLLGCYYE